MNAPSLALAVVAGMGGDPPVQVIVDMDASRPGIQSFVEVTTCTAVVDGIAVFVVDPLGARTMYSIGYLGGIDRGIAFGHVPGAGNHGFVASVQGQPVAPVNPGNVPWVVPTEWTDPAFAGPEVQYVEWGADEAAVIPADPLAPIFMVVVTITDALPGDHFAFSLFDFPAVWDSGSGPAGAFSTQGALVTLDTGGDAVPDATASLYGIDADVPVSVPPAAFAVDYIDGPPDAGPALILIVPEPADVDADGTVAVSDLVAVIEGWAGAGGPADVNDDGIVDVGDIVAVVLAWGGCG